MIQAINLNKVYKNGAEELHVLKDINLKIDNSEFVVIVGPSGAGKSTLLHLLAGLDTPTSGSVVFDKVDLYKIEDAQRAAIRNSQIGFVFQFYHLMPEFSVLENVLMPALIRVKGQGLRVKVKERAEELLAIMGLSGRIKHKPNQLSGGEQQRVAIARALMNSPKLLICDEPTGNLDSKTGNEVMQALLDLNKNKGVTCIMVTHEEGLSRDADRVLDRKSVV